MKETPREEMGDIGHLDDNWLSIPGDTVERLLGLAGAARGVREAEAQSYGDGCLGTEGSPGSPGPLVVSGESRDKHHKELSPDFLKAGTGGEAVTLCR